MRRPFCCPSRCAGCHFVSMDGKGCKLGDKSEVTRAPSKVKQGTTISASCLSEMVREAMKGVLQEQLEFMCPPPKLQTPPQGKKAKHKRSPSPLTPPNTTLTLSRKTSICHQKPLGVFMTSLPTKERQILSLHLSHQREERMNYLGRKTRNRPYPTRLTSFARWSFFLEC